MNHQELSLLCADRELKTPEHHTANDFYGHAHTLKVYCGLAPEYQIKAAIEHAPTLGEFVWGPDQSCEFPTILSFSPARFNQIRERSAKALFAIGSPILYAKSALTQEALAHERQRLGRSLLVFPSHSSHFLKIQYDLQDYCEKIKKVAKTSDCETVRVCLYWKDVLLGADQLYSAHGFELVSAGHMFDPLFLPRLRSIIESATFATSSEGSTAAGYCVALGLPFFLTDTPYEFEIQKLEHKESTQDELDRTQVFLQAVADSLPHEPVERLPTGCKESIDELWGNRYFRTAPELLAIFEILEDALNIAKQVGLPNHNYLFNLIPEYIKAAQFAKVLLIVQELERSDAASVGGLRVAQALALINLARKNEARGIISALLAENPNHEAALELAKMC